MIFPTFSVVKFVESDGFLTTPMQDYLDLNNQALMAGLSDNGWTFPQITAANLAIIAPKMPNGTAWYDTDNNEIVFKVNGALRKVTTAAYP